MSKHLLIDRIANEGARAIVKVIEAHTGREMKLYGTMQCVRVVGDAFHALDLPRHQIADRSSILLDEVVLREPSEPKGVLETIIDEIRKHDDQHPDHGRGCACHDKHSHAIRRLLSEKGIGLSSKTDLKSVEYKSLQNFLTVLNYVISHP